MDDSIQQKIYECMVRNKQWKSYKELQKVLPALNKYQLRQVINYIKAKQQILGE